MEILKASKKEAWSGPSLPAVECGDSGFSNSCIANFLGTLEHIV